MIKFFAKYKFFAIVMLFLSAIIIAFIYNALKVEPQLPVYQPDMVTADLVDSTVQHVRKFHKVKDFELINQNGDTLTQKEFDGFIYITDFFFTTCQTICPVMTDNMKVVQDEFIADEEIKLLSHTVTPQIDTVEKLRAHADEMGLIDGKWHMVTGDKKHIYDLARKEYLASKSSGDGGPYDLVHTENFVLVDKEKRIRGFYDGTNDDEIEKLIKDVAILKKEYQE
ncbi:SCO family protein [Psychroflexus maritimus]|uniref:SCO family protein n=1 Tax=Psychroflexus maritimus TaxID=2714865 RepID=A0A967AGW3_9FLAO|nr:SCO family protein [Psychroflexus maritimus]NGZ90256.1 SCO family protein [Psychroflexus maritimus]